MAERRREHLIIIQPRGEKPLGRPYPQVSYADRMELRRAVERAARRYWPTAKAISAEVDRPWQQCTGTVVVKTAGGMVVASFHPVHDSSRPADTQARPSTDARPVQPWAGTP